MSRLFIELYLDEDVSVLVAKLVRARGFAATTTLEESQLGTSDSVQLAYAVTQQKTLLTHNRADFERLAHTYFVAERTHQGIIIARRHSPHEMARRLMSILNQVTADEIQNQIRYI